MGVAKVASTARSAARERATAARPATSANSSVGLERDSAITRTTPSAKCRSKLCGPRGFPGAASACGAAWRCPHTEPARPSPARPGGRGPRAAPRLTHGFARVGCSPCTLDLPGPIFVQGQRSSLLVRRAQMSAARRASGRPDAGARADAPIGALNGMGAESAPGLRPRALLRRGLGLPRGPPVPGGWRLAPPPRSRPGLASIPAAASRTPAR
jgi:hypothetical protein